MCFKIFIRWRINQIKQGLPIEQQPKFQLKLLANNFLKQRSSFLDTNIHQEWKGDYLSLVKLSRLMFNLILI